MSGILSGLSRLGLGNLENVDIFAQPKKEEEHKHKEAEKAPEVQEKDLIYDKSYKCPVCEKSFPARVMKTGKARLIGMDRDLRPRHEAIDSVKYDAIVCPNCGCAALSRYFDQIGQTQAKLIREGISSKVQLKTYTGETYSYEQALERYQLCLANAVVKRGKTSEKAFICLKTAWLVRGYREALESGSELVEGSAEKRKALAAELAASEKSYLENAYKGFSEARQTEGFPMCGMDEMTMDYLLGVLAYENGAYDVASRMVATILTSTSANARIKDKARELKEDILQELKNAKK